MADLSRLLTGYSEIGGFVWDSRTHRLFFTSNGALNALDPVTGQVVVTPIPGATQLADLDLSPDGRYVLVGGASTDHPAAGFGTGSFYRVWLSDGHVDTITFPLQDTSDRSPPDVAVTSDNKALLAMGFGSYSWGDLRITTGDAPSPAVSDVANGKWNAGDLFVSESHRYVLFVETGVSSGIFGVYDAVAGKITNLVSMGQFPGHPYGEYMFPKADVSEAAGLVALGGDRTLLITDLSLKLVQDLSFDFDVRVQGLQFTPDGSQLMVMQYGTNQVVVFNTHTWDQVGVINLHSTVAVDTHSHNGALEFSNDGHFLFVDTASGIEVVDLQSTSISLGVGSIRIPRTVVTSPVRVAPGQTVDHPDLAYVLESPSTTTGAVLSIAGLVEAHTTSSYIRGVVAGIGGPQQSMLIESGGALKVSSTDPLSVTIGYSVPGFHGPSFENRGLLEVHGGDYATGVESYALDGSYVNSGTIRVFAREGATGMVLINLDGPGDVRNSGTIEVHDGGGQFGVSRGVGLASSWVGFRNDVGGSIRVIHDAPGPLSNVAVSIHADGLSRPTGATYLNAGLLQGDVALSFVQDSSNVYISYQRTFHNEATGTLAGAVNLSGNGIVLDNAGLIDGPVNMGAYSETYDGSRGGRVTGMVSGGGGDDYMTGGPGFDNFQGNQGDDNERGGGGDDWVVGGKDQDTLFGDAGDDIVYGNLGNDTCAGGDGADLIRGGQGDDLINGGAGADWLSGDRGADTLTGGAGADTFHTFAGADSDYVVDFKAAEGDRVQLDPGSAYSLRETADGVVIDLAGGGYMVLVGVHLSDLPAGWIFGA